MKLLMPQQSGDGYGSDGSPPPREILPPACAVVDPYRKDSNAPYCDFAGVGVAFKLIQALEGPECDVETLLENYGDLVAIGTIGDIVPLTGENRALF
jgi:single-stranded-DNA-specific exonuclease